VSCRGTIAAIFGITNEFAALQLQYVYSADITTTTTVRGGEGSRRWRLAEGQTPRFLALQYQPKLRLGSRRGTRITQTTVCACTVPILRLLPQSTMLRDFPHKILWKAATI